MGICAARCFVSEAAIISPWSSGGGTWSQAFWDQTSRLSVRNLWLDYTMWKQMDKRLVTSTQMVVSGFWRHVQRKSFWDCLLHFAPCHEKWETRISRSWSLSCENEMYAQAVDTMVEGSIPQLENLSGTHGGSCWLSDAVTHITYTIHVTIRVGSRWVRNS